MKIKENPFRNRVRGNIFPEYPLWHVREKTNFVCFVTIFGVYEILY